MTRMHHLRRSAWLCLGTALLPVAAPVAANAQALPAAADDGNDDVPHATKPSPSQSQPQFAPANAAGFVPSPQASPRKAPAMHYELRPRWNLFAEGVSAFAGMYLIDVIFGGLVNGEVYDYIPVVGPAIQAGLIVNAHNCGASGKSQCYDDASQRLAIGTAVISTLGQVAGVTMMGLAFALKVKVPVSGPNRVTVAPAISPALTGVMATGVF